jgi:WD40 repeat protein
MKPLWLPTKEMTMKFSDCSSLLLTILVTFCGAQAQDDPPRVLSAASPGVAPAVAGSDLAAFSPDGEFYVSVAPNGRIQYGRTDAGKPLKTFYHCQCRTIAFSPDGCFLVSAGQSCGGLTKLKVWRVAEGELVAEMEAHFGKDVLLRFSPDGKWLASTCGALCVEVWELPAGLLKMSARTCHSISRLDFSPRSRTLRAACVEGVKLSYSVGHGMNIRADQR